MLSFYQTMPKSLNSETKHKLFFANYVNSGSLEGRKNLFTFFEIQRSECLAGNIGDKGKTAVQGQFQKGPQ
jgi:hypothetical protein